MGQLGEVREERRAKQAEVTGRGGKGSGHASACTTPGTG